MQQDDESGRRFFVDWAEQMEEGVQALNLMLCLAGLSLSVAAMVLVDWCLGLALALACAGGFVTTAWRK